MIYVEILEKLIASGIQVSDFVDEFEDTYYDLEDDQFTPEEIEAERLRDEYYVLNVKDSGNKPDYKEHYYTWTRMPSKHNLYVKRRFDNLGVGPIETVYQKGGSDQGSDYYVVKYFKDHNVYIKISGYYSSYSGTQFEDWKYSCIEVKPEQKTITVYNPK